MNKELQNFFEELHSTNSEYSDLFKTMPIDEWLYCDSNDICDLLTVSLEKKNNIISKLNFYIIINK